MEGLAIDYDEFDAQPWLIAEKAERDMIKRLAGTCLRLDDSSLTSGIIVGVQTSADSIYHLKRLGTNSYLCQPAKEKGAKKKPPSFEVAIEDAIMKPLVSGSEAKRYEEPTTDTYLLFPYLKNERGVVRLILPDQMTTQFPLAWAYLHKWEKELRGREKGKFNNDQWYQFGRNQNLDKQEVAKLIVAQTVPEMRVCEDSSASKYLNNVRVNGILALNSRTLRFLLGCLNGPVADCVLRLIGKPKQGNYLEANKQFIVPIPIPDVDDATQKEIGDLAKILQEKWTLKRDLLIGLNDRLNVMPKKQHPLKLLWPTILPEITDLTQDAPASLKFRAEREVWAKAELATKEAACIASLQVYLDSGTKPEAKFQGGELRLAANDKAIIQGVYLDDGEGALAQNYWHYLLLTRGNTSAKVLAERLCCLPNAPSAAVSRQFSALVQELATLRDDIDARELQLNERLYKLYDLTTNERILVEKRVASRQPTTNQG